MIWELKLARMGKHPHQDKPLPPVLLQAGLVSQRQAVARKKCVRSWHFWSNCLDVVSSMLFPLWIPRLVIPDHCIQDGQDFSHAGSKCNLLGFARLNELFIKLLDGIVTP